MLKLHIVLYVFALIPWIKYRLYFVFKSMMLLFRYKVRQVRTIAHIIVLFSSPCIDWQTHVKLHVYASTRIFRPCPRASTHGRWSRTSKYLIRKKGTKMYRNICECVNSTCTNLLVRFSMRTKFNIHPSVNL